MKFEKKVEQLRIQRHKGIETKEFLDDVIKMAKSEPLEYLLGEVDFCNAKIDLSLHPMIPRIETEHWVKQAIENTRSKYKNTHVLDLFSGSGNVGIAFLKNISDCKVDMIEYDTKLKDQIEISIKKNNIDESRVKVMTGDTWEGANGLYDVITAVPPYVPPQMKDEVIKELLAESPLSFFDREDGYYYHKEVLSKAKEFLVDDGTLYLEFDITQREKIEQFAKEFGWTSFSFLIDPYGHEFVLVCVK